MTASKSERLLNLVILLLVSRTYVTKDRIREVIEGYHGAEDEAFEKMFERDKAELRMLGVPIEIGYTDKFFEDEQGYRIARDAFELPDIDFAPDELAMIGLAARVWQHAGLAQATSAALLKLRAAGHEVDREALDALRPRVGADEPAFDAMWSMTLSRTPVRFDYRRPGAAEAAERTLEPWGVVTSRDRWYVVGHDRDRGAPRMFRLSRITGPVRAAGRPGTVVVPDGTDLRTLTAALAPAPATAHARLLVRHGRAGMLRRSAQVLEPSVAGPDGETCWDRVELPMRSVEETASEVLSHLGGVVVEAPEELADRVRIRLAALAGEQA